ncbi:MAG: hypothetical protein KF832_12600 [Caldilineaceae bacterium]|nr:hypothetical protein [Caldilineaceae bacterium]
MADLALVTTGKLNVVESIVQMTLPFAETCAVGDAVRIDTTTGKWTKANGTSAAEARVWGILVSKDAAGAVGTALRKGVIDGFNLSSQAYDLAIYLSDTDGKLEDSTAPTVDVVVGRVIPAFATTLGTAADKLLQVDL